jgi:hypothetical protein
MVFGVNPLAGHLLRALSISHKDVPRFRDCFLHKDGTIVVYTRTGGGNRAEFEKENEAMRGWAGYLRDEDDSFDSTYALFHFSPPERLKGICEEMIRLGYAVDPAVRWKQTIEDINKR